MELRVLRYFLTVAREENITRAARQLHLSQPTLSRQLMQLEDEFGVRLFHRGGHSISLTQEGLLLKRRAQELLALSEKTVRELSHRENTLAGEIYIGCGETKNMATLAKHMAEFRRENPLVQFSIYSANADDIKERMESGSLDMGLLMEPVDISKYEFIHMPWKERWGRAPASRLYTGTKRRAAERGYAAAPVATTTAGDSEGSTGRLVRRRFQPATCGGRIQPDPQCGGHGPGGYGRGAVLRPGKRI